MSETAAEKFTTWACRNAAHATCGGIGFRMMPSGVDLPCVCPCHAQAMSEPQAKPAVDVERAAIGWRVAAAGDEQDAANFAYDHMDEILADLARVTAERDSFKAWAEDEQAKRKAAEDERLTAHSEAAYMAGVVEAARDVVTKVRTQQHKGCDKSCIWRRLIDRLARLDAQQKPS